MEQKGKLLAENIIAHVRKNLANEDMNLTEEQDAIIVRFSNSLIPTLALKESLDVGECRDLWFYPSGVSASDDLLQPCFIHRSGKIFLFKYLISALLECIPGVKLEWFSIGNSVTHDLLLGETWLRIAETLEMKTTDTVRTYFTNGSQFESTSISNFTYQCCDLCTAKFHDQKDAPPLENSHIFTLTYVGDYPSRHSRLWCWGGQANFWSNAEPNGYLRLDNHPVCRTIEDRWLPQGTPQVVEASQEKSVEEIPQLILRCTFPPDICSQNERE